MSDATDHPDAPVLRVVHDADDTGDPATDEAHDPLLARAERIAELPLRERPAAFDGLNRAVVAELQTLEEG
jgi:hypothetical protein